MDLTRANVSRELLANLPDSTISPYFETLQTGVYFGWARVLQDSEKTRVDQGDERDKVWPMVMSIGWNPFYNNDTRTAVRFHSPCLLSNRREWSLIRVDEASVGSTHFERLRFRFLWKRIESYHVGLHQARIQLLITRYLLPLILSASPCIADSRSWESTDALIKDIETDKKVAFDSVTTRTSYSNYKDDPFFTEQSTLEPPTEDLSKPRVKPTDQEEEK